MASIAIVGGGVAGLIAAWKLRRAGHDVEVIERADAPGGRMRSEVRDGFVLERGVELVTRADRSLRSVASLLGLEAELRPLPGPPFHVLRGGRFQGPLEVLPAKWRLAPLALALARHWRSLDRLRPEAATELDGEELTTGLARLAGPETRDFLLAPAFRQAFDREAEGESLAAGLLAARFALGRQGLLSFRGGNGAFTRALAAGLPVRLGCEVLSVETETGGARIRYRSGGREASAVADAAVVALPGSEVARVCPKLTPAERGFFEAIQYSRGIVAHLLLERPPQGLSGYAVAFPRPERFDLYGVAADHRKAGAVPRGAGLLHATLSERAAERLWDASDAAVADLVLENLAATPLGRLAPVGFAVARWPVMQPRFGPGALHRLARFEARLDRSPRLAFAGDYRVGPFAEAAVTSGLRAAREIARLV